MGEKRQVMFFGYVFCCFYGPQTLPGVCGGGRLKEGVGGGLIDLSKIRDLERSQISGPK